MKIEEFELKELIAAIEEVEEKANEVDPSLITLLSCGTNPFETL